MILVSSVKIVTRLQAGWSRSIFSMPGRRQNLFPRKMHTCSAVSYRVTGVLISPLRRSECKADHSIPTNAEFKNECNCPHASTFWPEKELLVLQFQCHNFQNPKVVQSHWTALCIRSLNGSLCRVTQRLFVYGHSAAPCVGSLNGSLFMVTQRLFVKGHSTALCVGSLNSSLCKTTQRLFV